MDFKTKKDSIMRLFILFLFSFVSFAAFGASQQDLKVDTVVVGAPTSATKTIKFNTGLGAANPAIKANPTTGKIQFTNDGSTFKDLGSGSGGGGGLNLITTGDFESGTAGWTTSGVTLSQQSYPQSADGNLKYASATATVVGAYLETTSPAVPSFLQNDDLENGGIYTSSNGQWRVSMTVSGTPVSQTLASSTTWAKQPFMVQPAVASAPIKIRYELVSVSGTSTLTFDDVYGGSKKSFANGAIIGSEITNVPTLTGFGTTTSNTQECNRIGSFLRCTGYFVAGTTAAATASVTIPAGLVIDTSKVVNVKKVGTWGAGSTTSTFVKSMIIIASNNVVYFTGHGTTQSDLALANGSSILSNGVNAAYEFTVPIVGQQGSGISFDGRCPNDLACTNVFGAMVSAGAISYTSNPGWVSCTNAAPAVCTFATNLIAVGAPLICNATYNAADGGGGSYFATISGYTSSSVSVSVYLDNGGSAVNKPFFLTCVRSTDSVIKSIMQGYLSQTLTTDGDYLYKTVLFKMSAVCSSSPCAYAYKSSSILSITRSGTGTYLINFVAGTFSQPPVCKALNKQNTVIVFTSTIADTTTAVQLVAYNPPSTLQDTIFDVECTGTR